jgi:hypothetical protein
LRLPLPVEGGRAFGPGVADMKAGLVMNTFVFEALARFGGTHHPVTVLYTSDEEVASGASRPVIEAVFNAEPGSSVSPTTSPPSMMLCRSLSDSLIAHAVCCCVPPQPSRVAG